MSLTMGNLTSLKKGQMNAPQNKRDTQNIPLKGQAECLPHKGQRDCPSKSVSRMPFKKDYVPQQG